MWNKIIGQEPVKEKLKMLFKSNKLAHAYLFFGYEGVGKDAVAIELAKLVNCENPVDGIEACDQCDSCKKIGDFKSEFFHFICALPAGRSEQTDSDPVEKLTSADFDNYLEQLEKKSKNPYHRIIIPNANNIRINSIREIINKIYLTSGKNRIKVFIISEADKMRQEASNALLKILEEPPKNSIIILTTSKPNVLPATVSGRCQRLFFEPLKEEQITQQLQKQVIEETGAEINTADLSLAARLANGSLSRAMSIIKIGVKDIRNSAVQFLVALLMNNEKETVMIIRNISENNNKERVRFFLYILNTWFKDLLFTRYHKTNGQDRILNYDVFDRVTRFAKNYPDTDIFGAILALEECEKYITQNVQLQLILTNLSFKLKSLIKQN